MATTTNELSAPSFHHHFSIPKNNSSNNNNSRTTMFNSRRKSDFSALNCNRHSEKNNLAALNASGAPCSTVSLQRTSSDRRFAMPSSLTSPSIASSSLVANNAGGTVSAAMASKRRRCSRVINFGYACAIYFLDEPPEMDDEDEYEEEEAGAEEMGVLAYQTVEGAQSTDNVQLIGTSSNTGINEKKNEDRVLENGTFGQRSSVQESDYVIRQIRTDNNPQLFNEVPTVPGELFLLRHQNEEIPHYCIRPQGMEADRFIQQSLSERNRSEIKKFLERNVAPDDGDWSYLWISQDLKLENCPVFIFSIKMLENFFKNERIRRVKWRHLSIDKVSVYRYSLPQITTKFRLRIAHFLVRHYRCCILCVWLLIILCISVGIIFSVVFGSPPTGTSKVNDTFVQSSAHHQPEHRGGFMEDEIIGDDDGIGEEAHQPQQLQQKQNQLHQFEHQIIMTK
ncbi:hypothetical protein niasHT_032395 [Heterodera trifolii]|uniref:Uncharacterized protein n=1 Tax=Heterodera trifolii TaxID=157864 RepID=A0ABD2I0G4_9BILA